MEKEWIKIKDIKPEMNNIYFTAKVVNVGEPKDIPSRYGTRRVAEAVIGDDTGTVILSLWNEQIGMIKTDDVISVNNGYVSIVPRERGHIRVNVSRYGNISKTDKTLQVNTDLDMSAPEYEGTRKTFKKFEERKGFRRF